MTELTLPRGTDLGIANQAALARMGSAFHTVGLSSELAGVHYDLGLLFPA